MTTLNSESTEFGRFGFSFDSSFETFFKDSDVFLFGQKFFTIFENFWKFFDSKKYLKIMEFFHYGSELNKIEHSVRLNPDCLVIGSITFA